MRADRIKTVCDAGGLILQVFQTTKFESKLLPRKTRDENIDEQYVKKDTEGKKQILCRIQIISFFIDAHVLQSIWNVWYNYLLVKERN